LGPMGDPREKSPFLAFAVYGAAGVQLAASVVAGLFIGDYIDKKAGTGPWITVAGLALGFAGGLINMFRIVKTITRNGGGEDADSKD